MRKRIQAILAAAAVVIAQPSIGAGKLDQDKLDQDKLDQGIEQRVEAMVEQMTLEEKVDLLGGINFFDIKGVPRVGLAAMATADGPFGVRRSSRANVMAGGIALAATWNADLARSVGTQMGRDARARGVHFYLAPGVNIYRSPLNGRNFEYFGEDPWLAARMAVAFIDGVQSQQVAATIKHFIGNNSEFARHTTDSIIDERAAREIYLPVFEAAVKEAKVAAVMSSYNLVNGEHMSQNRHFVMDVLKGEWRFDGVFMSDWDATYDALAAANNGLDLEMPSGKLLNRATLLPLIRDRKVTQQTLDDKVRRIVRTAARMGWLDRPQVDPAVARFNSTGRAAALQSAREGIVLLKNANALLPFDPSRIRSIAVIGPNGYPTVLHGGGSATVVPFRSTSLLEGLSNELGPEVAVHHARGIADLHRIAGATSVATAVSGGQRGFNVEVFDNLELAGAPSSTRIDRSIDQGAPTDFTALATGEVEFDLSMLSIPKKMSTRWVGYYTPAQAGNFDVVTQVGGFSRSLGYRLYIDDKLVADRWTRKVAPVQTLQLPLEARPYKIVFEHRTETGGLDGAVPFVRLGIIRQEGWVDAATEQLAASVDAVVLAVGFDPASETEDWDRSFQLPPGQDELIRRVARLNKNTVVVVTSGGAVDTTNWLNDVSGLVQAWYLGQEGGTAVAEVLSGAVNPSGRLPASFERRWEDNPVHDSYYPENDTNRVRYQEGVFVGYRGYEQRGVQPQFAFGTGLSYTTFKYDALTIEPARSADTLYEVSFMVQNTGARPGAVVPQLYVADVSASVPRPKKELKGFTKIVLQPGESRRVTLPLNTRSFAFYDVGAKRWVAEAGRFQVLIGNASDAIVLQADIDLKQTIALQR